MKTLIPLMLFTLLLNSQNNVSIGIYQDPKLALTKDSHGNEPFTLDAKLLVELNGKQLTWSYYSMRVEAEFADLSGGSYSSYLVSGGWIYNRLFINDLEMGGYFTIGLLNRWGEGYAVYGLTGDISYKLTKRLKLSLLGQYINRGDLKAMYNTNGMKFNGYVGLKYNLK